MVVVTLEKCPLSLRGDLTKWLQEVGPGVYVGQVSARVRDKLWARVCEECSHGRATMVFTARNEQRYDFRVHNTAWEPIDFDGLKLMLRPSAARVRAREKKSDGFSAAGFRRLARHSGARKAKKGVEPAEYVVVDLETTGLDPQKDEILEIGSIRYVKGKEAERFQRVVRTEGEIPRDVRELTGITSEEIDDGVSLEAAIDDFLEFVGYGLVVIHNAPFDLGFLDAAFEQCGYGEMENEWLDTLELAKRKLPSAGSHRLQDLAKKFGCAREGAHRSVTDCLTTHDVYLSLLELEDS